MTRKDPRTSDDGSDDTSAKKLGVHNATWKMNTVAPAYSYPHQYHKYVMS